MNIHIDLPSGKTTNDLSITLDDGSKLTTMVKVDIRLRKNEIPSATIEFSLPGINTDAEVTVSKEHLEELAAAHGFDLVKKK